VKVSDKIWLISLQARVLEELSGLTSLFHVVILSGPSVFRRRVMSVKINGKDVRSAFEWPLTIRLASLGRVWAVAT
jgi:hypothetical protein